MNGKDAVSRRQFLKKTAAATAALSIASRMQASRAAQDSTILCGVIGTGAQGQKLLRELVAMKDIELVALCDIYQPHLDKALKITGEDIFSYNDYREMLDSHEDMQAVIIATPPATHAEITLQALRFGKHVFCETPLALNAEQCRQISKAAKESNLIFQIGLQRRYSPLYRHALEFIKSGVIGNIVAIRAQWNKKQSWRRGVPDKKYEKLLNWRLYKESSGGLTTEFGCHQIDVANWFLNSLPCSVSGLGGINLWKDGRQVYDNVHLLFEYANGAKLFFSASLDNSFQREYELIMGTLGTILISEQEYGLMFKEADAVALGWEEFAKKEMLGDERGIVLDANATKYEIQEGKKVKIKQEKSNYRLELEDFFNCIREGKKPAADYSVALRSTLPCILANEAMEKRAIIRIDKQSLEA